MIFLKKSKKKERERRRVELCITRMQRTGLIHYRLVLESAIWIPELKNVSTIEDSLVGSPVSRLLSYPSPVYFKFNTLRIHIQKIMQKSLLS